MFYKIIEDCSPYYVKFTYDGIQNLIDFVNTLPIEFDKIQDVSSYKQYYFPFDDAQEIVNRLPLSTKFRFKRRWAPLMIMPPGKFTSPHKDSPGELCSFNFPIKIADDKCVVSWYSDEEFTDFNLTYIKSYTNTGRIFSRKILPEEYNNKLRSPSKQLILGTDECVLFNTNIFHSIDNTESTNNRIILTLRLIEDTETPVTFEDAKSVLFKN